MISVKDIKVQEQVSKYIQPGVVEAKITKIESITSKTGTPGFKIYFETAAVPGLNGAGQTLEESMYLSEKSVPITVSRLKKIAAALGVETQFNTVDADESVFGNVISPIFSNRPARWFFTGEEIAGTKGSWIKAKLYGGFSFVEPLSVSPSKLPVFDPEQHVKKLQTVNKSAGLVVNKNVEELY